MPLNLIGHGGGGAHGFGRAWADEERARLRAWADEVEAVRARLRAAPVRERRKKELILVQSATGRACFKIGYVARVPGTAP